MNSRPGTTNSVNNAEASYNHKLEQKILLELNKLNDNDTRLNAVATLRQIIPTLNADTFPLFLSSLKRGTATDVKSSARREYIRLFSSCTAFVPHLCQMHLQRMIRMVLKWCNDNDTSVRNASADAIGFLASDVHLLSSDSNLSLFFKPLFKLLLSNNQNTQDGAALCIARLLFVSNTNKTLDKELPKLCPKLQAIYEARPCATARATLHKGLGNLIKTSNSTLIDKYIDPFIEILLCDMIEHGNDWRVRQASAITIGVAINHIGNKKHILRWRSRIIETLQEAKSDRVSNVREAVQGAIDVLTSVSMKSHQATKNKRRQSHRFAESSSSSSGESAVISCESKASNKVKPVTSKSKSNGNLHFDQKRNSCHRSTPNSNVNINLNKIIQQQERLMTQLEKLSQFTYSNMSKIDSRLNYLEEKLKEVSNLQPSEKRSTVDLNQTSKVNQSRNNTTDQHQQWDEMVEMLSCNEDKAYRLAFRSCEMNQNNMLLIRLMTRSGPSIMDRLKEKTIITIVEYITQMLQTRQFEDVALFWMERAALLGSRFINTITVSKQNRDEIILALQTIASDPKEKLRSERASILIQSLIACNRF